MSKILGLESPSHLGRRSIFVRIYGVNSPLTATKLTEIIQKPAEIKSRHMFATLLVRRRSVLYLPYVLARRVDTDTDYENLLITGDTNGLPSLALSRLRFNIERLHRPDIGSLVGW